MIPFDWQEAMKSGVYISGTTGTGKTDVAMYQAEQLMKEGVIVIVFDPSQDWRKRSFFESYRTIPSRLAGMYEWDAEHWIPNHSMIFDISELSVKQAQRFVEGFCKALMEQQAKCESNPTRYFLIFEEAQIYFPQGCMTAIALQEVVRMMTVGRNFGVRFCCITQFASMIDKKAMRYMTQRYFGTTDEPNDVTYIGKFFRNKDYPEAMPMFNREEVEDMLPLIPAGRFIYKKGEYHTVFQITPFLSETKPQPAEVPERTAIAPVAETRQYQNTGNGIMAMARLAFVIIFALIFLWIIANAR